MQKNYAIVVDSSLIPSYEVTKLDNVFVQSLYVVEDQESFKDYVDIQPAEIYARLRSGSTFQTSQPSVGDFVTTYEHIIQQGYKNILVFTISKVLSGTNQSANMAASQFPEINIKVIDTKIAAALCWEIIEEIMKKADTTDFVEVAKYSETAFDGMEVIAYIGNIDYLKRGGRLSSANAMIANLLKIRPILQLKSGDEIKAIDKTRSLQKALETVVDLVKEKNPQRIMLLTTDEANEELMNKFIPLVKEAFPAMSFTQEVLSPAVGVHIGPEICAIMYQV